MTAELRELYQCVILDHNKKPRNFRKLADANHHAEGYNPLCGDKVTVYLKLDKDVIVDVSFVGSGCAISTASASLMTEQLKGKTRAEAETLFRQFHDLLTGPDRGAGGVSPLFPEAETSTLGKLQAFTGVREFPVRVKCATLAWHVFLAALRDEATPVSTE